MPGFEAGDVVRVPFPYTNRPTTQHRPALVISEGPIASGMLLWVLMITSEANRPWPGDVRLAEESAAAGLPVPSMVRTAKIATIEAGVADRLGAVSAQTLERVRSELSTFLGF